MHHIVLQWFQENPVRQLAGQYGRFALSFQVCYREIEESALPPYRQKS
jgi:hypothetical protein